MISWGKSFTELEYWLIALFVLLSAAFLYRNYVIAKRLHSESKSVWVKFIVRTIYFSLFIVALLGPSFGALKKEIKAVGKDIYIAVDVSQSMDATDVQPSRLAKIKYELNNILSAFSSDRIGLIIFSADAFMQCPLTHDQNALHIFLESINSGLMSSGGTDFGKALDMALQKHLDPTNSSTKQQSKIILLISDGEDFGDDTQEAVQEIETNGIKLFTLGVGTLRGGNIPEKSGYKLDNEGRRVVTRLNSTDLREIATQAGGQYFEISDTRNEVPQLIQAIGQIEGQVRDVKKLDVGANKYYYPLFIAMILLVMDILFTVSVIKL